MAEYYYQNAAYVRGTNVHCTLYHSRQGTYSYVQVHSSATLVRVADIPMADDYHSVFSIVERRRSSVPSRHMR